MKRTVKLILYYFAYQLATASVFSLAFMLTHHLNRLPNASDPGFMQMSIAAQAIATIGLGLHLLIGKYADVRKEVNSSHPVQLYLIAALFIIAMGCWTNYVSELLSLPDNMEDVFNAMLRNPVGIISIVLLAPMVEELLFRGAIQGHLTRTWKNPAYAIVVSALVFGLVHGNPKQIPFAFVTGLALGWVYYRTGSLLPSMFMHFLNNGSSVLLFYLTDNPQSTMQELLGAHTALAVAIGGIIISGVCVWLIQKRLTYYGYKEK